MDELENDALSLILLMDDNLFPQCLEFFSSHVNLATPSYSNENLHKHDPTWADLIFFLLECDNLRFPQEPSPHYSERNNKHDQRCNYGLRSAMLAKISECIYMDAFDDADKKVTRIDRLVRSKIPLHAVFASVCDRVWSKVISRCRLITRSNIWSSLRRELLSALDSMEPNLNLDMIAVLTDSTYRKYFDRFIRSNPADTNCLHCWLRVRRLLQAVAVYHQQSNIEPNSPIRVTKNNLAPNTKSRAVSLLSEESHTIEADNVIDNSKKRSSLLSRWRLSSTQAVSSANKVLQANSSLAITTKNMPTTSNISASVSASGSASNHGGNMHGSSSSRKSTMDDGSQGADQEYTDPFVVYKILLEGVRQVQKQFFPPQNNSSSSSSSSSGGSGSSVSSPSAGSRRTSISPASIKSQSPPPLIPEYFTSSMQQISLSSSSMDSNFSGRSSVYAINEHSARSSGTCSCSGLSDSLRMEIAATLSLNSIVKTKDIEAVDRAFAFACANQLEKLMTNLENETVTHIKSLFSRFTTSDDDYIKMICVYKGRGCKRLKTYTNFLLFLNDRVRLAKAVSWRDPCTKGKLYLYYGTASSEDSKVHFSSSVYDGISNRTSSSFNSNSDTFQSANGGPNVRSSISMENFNNGHLTVKEAMNLEDSNATNNRIFAMSAEFVVPVSLDIYQESLQLSLSRLLLFSGGRDEEDISKILLNPVDSSVIEASLVKGGAAPAPSHLANIRVHLNEIFAKVIIALCEGGSNSPTLFPGDEMFESDLEESFIFVTHSSALRNLMLLIHTASVDGKDIAARKEMIVKYLSVLETEMSLSSIGPCRIPWAEVDKNKNMFQVCVRIKSSRVKQHASYRFGGPDPTVDQGIHRSDDTVLNNSKLHINVGVTFMRVQANHSMISALSRLSLSVFRVLYSPSSTAEEKPPSNERLMVPIICDDPYVLKSLDPSSSDYKDSPFSTAIGNQEGENTDSAESLYDIYITSPEIRKALDLNHCGGTVESSNNTIDNAVEKQFGICDFSLCSVVESVSIRLMIQILMLILCEKPIILLSSSSSLLTKLIHTIPRLLWPFQISNTHTLINILNERALRTFCGGSGKEDQPHPLQSHLLHRAHSLGSTRSNSGTTSIYEVSSDFQERGYLPTAVGKRSLDLSMSQDAYSGSVQQSRDIISVSSVDRQTLRTPSVNLAPPVSISRVVQSPTMAIKCNVCAIVFMDSNTFFAMNNETRGILLALTAYKDSMATVIDLDACLVQIVSHDGTIQRNDSRSTMDTAQSLSVGISASDSAESIAITAAVSVDISGLSDQSLFQRSNMKVVYELLSCNQRLFEKFRKAIETEPLKSLLSEERRICSTTATYNRKVECAFHTFWSEILLREVPSNIFHYPSSDVISFDMRAMLSKLLQLAVDMDLDRQYCYDHKRKSEKSATQQDKDMADSNSSSSSHSQGRYILDAMLAALDNRLHGVGSEELLSGSDNSDQLPHALDPLSTENLLLVFYSEFFLKHHVCNSIFRNFLFRHKDIMLNWAF